MHTHADVTVKGKGGREKLPERPGENYRLRPVILYDGQWAWLKAQAGGASDALRRMIDKAMRADARKRGDDGG